MAGDRDQSRFDKAVLYVKEALALLAVFSVAGAVGYGHFMEWQVDRDAKSGIRTLSGEFAQAGAAHCGGGHEQQVEKLHTTIAAFISGHGTDITSYSRAEAYDDLRVLHDHGVIVIPDETLEDRGVLSVLYNNSADEQRVLSYPARFPALGQQALALVAGDLRRQGLREGMLAVYRRSTAYEPKLAVLEPGQNAIKFRFGYSYLIPDNRCVPAIL